MNRRNFRRTFNKLMNENDEFIAPGTTTDFIIDMIKFQGYWSGLSYRYYFNEDLSFNRMESRWN